LEEEQKEKLKTLQEYNDDFDAILFSNHKEHYTNIKCEKCDGRYEYVDFYSVYRIYPPQRQIICDKCGDKKFIRVFQKYIYSRKGLNTTMQE
jgi:hypothetical protein